MLRKPIQILILSALIAGCSENSERFSFKNIPTFGILDRSEKKAEVAQGGENVELAILTPNQAKMVRESVRKVIPNSFAADFKEIKAVRFSEKEGLHVCGYIEYSQASQQNEKTIPFYVELRNAQQQDVVHRGQVGTDRSKTSKINFVCRFHKSVQS